MTTDKSKIKTGKTSANYLKPLKRHQRVNPNLDPPEITEKEMEKGIIHLVNEGYIPKDVDVTPAFERGCATLTSKKMDILDQREMVRT